MGLIKLFKIIKFHGGLKKSFQILFRTDTLKIGELKGRDAFGNLYYENNYYFFASNRWVIYSENFGLDYDATQIHSKWFRWIHHMTDKTPCEDKRPTYPWMLPHTENMTGTDEAYIPYSTTKPKIIPWTPKPST